LLDREREHAKHELTESMRSLEVQVARLESALSTLQMALNIERNNRPAECVAGRELSPLLRPLQKRQARVALPVP